MTSRERVLAALRREEPDRVPIVEFLIDPKVVRAVAPGAADAAACMDRLGLDAVGCGVCFDRVEERGDGRWIDEWGVLFGPGPEMVAHPIRGPIRGMDDLRRYAPPDPEAPGRLGDLPSIVARFRGRRAIIFHQRAAFMWAAYLAGLERLLESFLIDPEFAGALLDMVLEVNMAIARRAIRAGAEAIVLGDDYAYNRGPFMAPDLFRRFISPRLARMVDAIHEERALAIKHTDGNIYPLLEALAASGADALNPIEPAAGMDLGSVKRRVGDRMALVGNIDCGELLSRGTPAEVREAVRRAILDAGPGGGFILSSSNSIHSSVRPENFLAMIEAGRTYGAYPLEGALDGR
ncbi:MAG: hypothetical protein JXP34_07250 [Planctomycetes bacterium]|nr:hypothetical protein [Planctomycetota bacterium]